ncbi:DNA double-strand break repair nuclease NurA, partial [Candidatus Woesearchaeota archaeon]|nr:DNA double-strand break repair nuclease NurA [Candidatus Woesearchaeota archaeon]
MRRAISKIINALDSRIIKEQTEIKDTHKEIIPKEHNKQIAFIDGGNAELLKSSSFSLQIIRISAVILKNNKKTYYGKKEFFTLTYEKENKYSTEMFPVKDNMKLSISDFNQFDITIKQGMQKADISTIGNIIRRFAELKTAEEITEKLNKEDLIILDGSLKCIITDEEKYMDSLLNKANERSITVCALAKTSDNKMIPNISLNNPSFLPAEEMFIVKLNKSGKYYFQFETNKKEKIEEILEQLAKNCSDAVFPGYPYGLILADKFARISNKEKEYLLTVFQAKAGKTW